MKKKTLLLVTALALTASAFAQNAPTLQWYGFFRSFYTVDSRESKSGTAEQFYWVPLDRNMVGGTDLNEHTTTKFSSLTSRLGLNVTGYQYEGLKVGGKFEADFYSGLTGVTGTATFRLRQAYISLDWTRQETAYAMKIGQTWHPMAADMPDIFDLETGVPFGPFSRTPQVQFESKTGHFTLTAAALWQMQFTSTGPEGASANYIKYGNTPEIYLGLSYTDGPFIARAGVDVLSIKPRFKNATGLVRDRITTMSPFLYLQYKKDLFTAKLKTTLSEAGEHMHMIGGYGVSDKSDAANWQYTPTRTSATWLSLSYGSKLQGVFFAGYAKNLGTKDALVADIPGYAAVANNFLAKNTYANLTEVYRVEPALIYNLGKLQFGVELQMTSAHYGDYLTVAGVNYVPASNGLVTENMRWVTNYRLLGLAKFTF